MAKQKAGLFSFEARGTIANSVTFQHEHARDYARAKPTPTDRLTLPQQYQRWLYQDYIAWWHTLSAAAKQTWETNARPYHMTGFAYWMKAKLGTLGDIKLGYRMDERGGTSITDFSGNGNTGIRYGATHTSGFIDYGLSFDGIDDRVDLGTGTSKQFADLEPWSVSIFLKCTVSSNFQVFLYSWRTPAYYGANFMLNLATKLDYYVLSPYTLRRVEIGAYQDQEMWITLTMNTARNLKVYRNGVYKGSVNLPISAVDFRYLGREYYKATPTLKYNGLMDHLVICNRTLDPSEAGLYSERRYP